MKSEEVHSSLSNITDLLTDDQKEEFLKEMQVEWYERNRSIYSEGDKPEYLLCLISGKVKIYTMGVGGRMQIVHILKPTAYFGYRAYFASQRYLTYASAFEKSLICKIPLKLVEEMMQTNVRLSMFFVKMLSMDLGVSDSRTVSLTQKHIRGRLADSLLFLRKTYGVEEDGATLSIKVSREDLAGLSNMTTSNAIRTLSGFASENLLEVSGRSIKIINSEALQKISDFG